MVPKRDRSKLQDEQRLRSWLTWASITAALIYGTWFVPLHYFLKIPWGQLVIPLAVSAIWLFVSALLIRSARAKWRAGGTIRPLVVAVHITCIVFIFIAVATGWALGYLALDFALVLAISALIVLAGSAFAGFHIFRDWNIRAF